MSAEKKYVGYKWIYIVKYRVNGSIKRYKIRLVAKDYTQTYGIYYIKSFASVAKMNTIRILLSLAANYSRDCSSYAKNAFLHGELEEKLYMEVPPGYEGKLATHTMCKLKTALHGQSPLKNCAGHDGYGI